MRIVGGALKGRRLSARPGLAVRPTGERVREALFNVLAHGIGDGSTVEGRHVLDLFAGTGALGFEALSRGAAACTFVETAAPAAAAIEDAALSFGISDRVTVLRRDAARLGRRPGAIDKPFDLVFCDPPYGKGLAERALAAALRGGWLAPRALCVVEESLDAGFAAPTGFEPLDARRYGKTLIAFLRARS